MTRVYFEYAMGMYMMFGGVLLYYYLIILKAKL
jgi:hypothetical protein